HVKRTVITKFLNEGLYPYTKRYLGSFDNHFSTIGLVGMNETALNACWLKKNLTTEEGQQFAKDVLNHMRERLSDYQEQYGDLYNLEATPAESTSYRLAKHDVSRFPGIITANMEGTPYYTNSSHLPVGFTDDIFTALDMQDELHTLYTSGTVFHAYMGEKLPDWKAAANLVRKIAENYRLPYYSMSPTYTVCKNHGYIAGEVYTCPICGETTEVYSRITGYYRPVQNWNDGKSQEFKDRKLYDQRIAATKNPAFHGGCCCSGDAEPETVGGNRIMLFTTKTCPNCKMAAAVLDQAGIAYEKLDAEAPENRSYVEAYQIDRAPTLIVETDGGIEKLTNASEIRSFTKRVNANA
ncbi:MAG: ribonucleoside triphosphate reductase, partial [Clostridia bacterium]|nr:ribonucleoside triphosphate reductase [Clostridia bacterium]